MYASTNCTGGADEEREQRTRGHRVGDDEVVDDRPLDQRRHGGDQQEPSAHLERDQRLAPMRTEERARACAASQPRRRRCRRLVAAAADGEAGGELIERGAHEVGVVDGREDLVEAERMPSSASIAAAAVVMPSWTGRPVGDDVVRSRRPRPPGCRGGRHRPGAEGEPFGEGAGPLLSRTIRASSRYWEG